MSQTPKKSQVENKLNEQSEKRSTGSKQIQANQSNSKDENDSQVQHSQDLAKHKPIQEQQESSEEDHKPNQKRKLDESHNHTSNSGAGGAAKLGTPKKQLKALAKKSSRQGKQLIESTYACFNSYCLRKSNIITRIEIKSHSKSQGREFEDPEFHPFKAYEKSIIEYQRQFNKDSDTVEIYLCEDCIKFHKNNQFCYYCKQIYYEDIDVDNLAWIQCDQCEKWLHQDEVNKYKPAEFEQFDFEKNEYLCPACYYPKQNNSAGSGKAGGQQKGGAKQKRNNGKGNKNAQTTQEAKKQGKQNPQASTNHQNTPKITSNVINSLNNIEQLDLQPTKKQSMDEKELNELEINNDYGHLQGNGMTNNIYTTNRYKDHNNLGELPNKNKRKEKEKEKQQSKLEEILQNHGITLQLDDSKIQEDILFFQSLRKVSCQIDEIQSKLQLDQDSTQLNQTMDVSSNRNHMDIEPEIRKQKNSITVKN